MGGLQGFCLQKYKTRGLVVEDEAEGSREGPRGALNTIFRGLDFAQGVMKSAQSPFPKMDRRPKKEGKKRKK